MSARTRREFARRQAAAGCAIERTQEVAQMQANAQLLDEIMRDQERKPPALKAKQRQLLAILKRRAS